MSLCNVPLKSLTEVWLDLLQGARWNGEERKNFMLEVPFLFFFFFGCYKWLNDSTTLHRDGNWNWLTKRRGYHHDSTSLWTSERAHFVDNFSSDYSSLLTNTTTTTKHHNDEIQYDLLLSLYATFLEKLLFSKLVLCYYNSQFVQ